MDARGTSDTANTCSACRHWLHVMLERNPELCHYFFFIQMESLCVDPQPVALPMHQILLTRGNLMSKSDPSKYGAIFN